MSPIFTIVLIVYNSTIIVYGPNLTICRKNYSIISSYHVNLDESNIFVVERESFIWLYLFPLELFWNVAHCANFSDFDALAKFELRSPIFVDKKR